jgi:hypothetical protein
MLDFRQKIKSHWLSSKYPSVHPSTTISLLCRFIVCELFPYSSHDYKKNTAQLTLSDNK